MSGGGCVLRQDGPAEGGVLGSDSPLIVRGNWSIGIKSLQIGGTELEELVLRLPPLGLSIRSVSGLFHIQLPTTSPPSLCPVISSEVRNRISQLLRGYAEFFKPQLTCPQNVVVPEEIHLGGS